MCQQRGPGGMACTKHFRHWDHGVGLAYHHPAYHTKPGGSGYLHASPAHPATVNLWDHKPGTWWIPRVQVGNMLFMTSSVRCWIMIQVRLIEPLCYGLCIENIITNHHHVYHNMQMAYFQSKVHLTPLIRWRMQRIIACPYSHPVTHIVHRFSVIYALREKPCCET